MKKIIKILKFIFLFLVDYYDRMIIYDEYADQYGTGYMPPSKIKFKDIK